MMKKASTTKKPVTRFWPFGLLLFTVLLFLDQYTKNYIITNYALGTSHKIAPGLWFTYVQNTGTLWGLFRGAGANAAFIWLSVIAFGLLIFFFDQFKTTIEKIAYTLLLAGLWGNLLDRGVHGFVIDFIDLGWWPVFNIADSCILVGIALFTLHQLTHNFKKPTKLRAS